MSGFLHVVGDRNSEALAVVREVPDTQKIDGLTQKFSRDITVIAQATPDRLMTNVLKEIDAFKTQGEVIYLTMPKIVGAIFIAFTSGWNAFRESTTLPGTSVPKDYREFSRAWFASGKNCQKIDEYPLSDSVSTALLCACHAPYAVSTDGKTTPNIIEELDIAFWQGIVTEAFKDGWNASRHATCQN